MTNSDQQFTPAEESHRQTGLTEYNSTQKAQRDSDQSQTHWPLFTDDLPADIAEPTATKHINDTCAVLAARKDMTTELIVAGLEQYIESILTPLAPLNPPQSVNHRALFTDRNVMNYTSQFRPVCINLDAAAKSLITDQELTPHAIYTGATELLALIEARGLS